MTRIYANVISQAININTSQAEDRYEEEAHSRDEEEEGQHVFQPLSSG